MSAERYPGWREEVGFSEEVRDLNIGDSELVIYDSENEDAWIESENYVYLEDWR